MLDRTSLAASSKLQNIIENYIKTGPAGIELNNLTVFDTRLRVCRLQRYSELSGVAFRLLLPFGVFDFLFFQDIKGKSNRVEAILNHLMTRRPDEDFVKFCRVLQSTNQPHIVQLYLNKDSSRSHDRRNPASSSSSSSGNSSRHPPPVPLPKSTSDRLQQLESDDRWRQVLIERRASLIERMDVSGDILNRLLSLGVMNKSIAEKCQVKNYSS